MLRAFNNFNLILVSLFVLFYFLFYDKSIFGINNVIEVISFS